MEVYGILGIEIIVHQFLVNLYGKDCNRSPTFQQKGVFCHCVPMRHPPSRH